MMARAFLLLFTLFVVDVSPLGVEFVCPVIKKGVNIVSCKINRAAVTAAKCASDETVIFDHTSSTGVTLTLCQVQSFTDSACSSVSQPSANSCWCNGLDGEIFDYKFAYMADDTRDLGAGLECKICVPSKKNLDVDADKNCRNMTFGSPDLPGGRNGVIAGIVAGIVVVVILAIVCAKYRRQLRHYHFRTKDVVKNHCKKRHRGIPHNSKIVESRDEESFHDTDI